MDIVLIRRIEKARAALNELDGYLDDIESMLRNAGSDLDGDVDEARVSYVGRVSDLLDKLQDKAEGEEV